MHGKKPVGVNQVVGRSHKGYNTTVYGWGRGSEVFLTCIRRFSLSHNAPGVVIPLQVKFLQDMHLCGFIYFVYYLVLFCF
jgi:hypothetical protein